MEVTINEMQHYQLDMLRIIAEVCERENIHYLLHGGNLLGAIRHGGPIPWDYDTDILVPENQIDTFCNHLQKALAPNFRIDYHKLSEASTLHFPRISIAGCASDVCHIDIFRLVGFPGDPKQQQAIVNKVAAIRKMLVLKSRKSMDDFLKNLMLKIVKLPLAFVPGSSLLKAYNKACSKYPYEQADYAGYLAGKFGVKNIFPRKIFDSYTIADYAGIPVRIVKDYDEFLTRLYGDYMKLPPMDEQEKPMKKTYIIKELDHD